MVSVKHSVVSLPHPNPNQNLIDHILQLSRGVSTVFFIFWSILVLGVLIAVAWNWDVIMEIYQKIRDIDVNQVQKDLSNVSEQMTQLNESVSTLTSLTEDNPLPSV